MKETRSVGEVGILNVGAGDTKLTFDPTKPEEVEKAARTVKDMVRRGYVLLIEVGQDERGPIYRRAHDFDADTAEYIIAGAPPADLGKHHEQPPAAPRRGRKAAQERVPAAKVNAVAVARTAGG